MYLVLPSHAPGSKEGAAKLARWPVLSSTRNTKDGGQNDSLCIATSEETVHRRSFVFQLQQLIPRCRVNITIFSVKSQEKCCLGNRHVAMVTNYKKVQQRL